MSLWKGTAKKLVGPHSDCGFNFYHQHGPKRENLKVFTVGSSPQSEAHINPLAEMGLNTGRQQFSSFVTLVKTPLIPKWISVSELLKVKNCLERKGCVIHIHLNGKYWDLAVKPTLLDYICTYKVSPWTFITYI